MGLEKRLANLSISEKPNDGAESSTRRRLPSEEEQEMFNKLVTKAKQLAGDGRVREALELNRQAFGIFESDKLAKRISKMEAYLKEFGDGEGSEENEDDDEGMVHLGKGFFLFKDLHDKLYSHQKEGVLWLWGLHQKGKGGILGDDMGLGKTIQVISFLSGMFDADKVKTVLVVLPVSLMAVWEKEIDKWAPGIKVVSYHGTSKRERERGLMKIQRRGGVCLTTYGLVVSSWDKLSQEDGREFVWDYIILDEGHKIKNPTKTSKGVRAIGAKNRIILTGTPIQNNLQELWALFDFVHHGALLGTSRTFKMEYDTPITRARERDATAGEKRLGMEMAESLKQIISPYFLRRTKAEVTAKSKEKENEVGEDEAPSKELQMPSMTRKNDLIVWLFLTDAQKKIYEDFISLEDVKALLMTHKSPLVALTVLKKLCDHPRLMSTRACMKLGLTTDEDLDEDDVENEKGLQCAANRIQFIADEMLISESGKMIFLVELLDNLKSHGHRCLVFSQSTKMLNIIQKVITNRGHRVMRLDGTVTQIADREARIQKFQRDMTYTVFLLTTQVGGVGLTLTSADRVVIFDPSWNPATDAQAVDRVFRIGQDKNVVIYRLITCGTVEEKIYRRQVFKDSITRQTTGNSKNPYRYFTKQELKELFSLDNPHFSTTQKQLEEMHGSHRSSDTTLDEHIAYLHSLNIFGISDHDLMFNVDQSRQDEGNIVDEGNDYISSRVQKAQQLLHMESSLTAEQRAQMEKPARLSDTDQTKKNKPRSPYVDPDQYQPPPPSPLRKQDLEPEVVQLDSPSPVKPRENKHQQSPPSPNSSEYQRLSSDEDDKTDESADQMEQAPDNQEMVDDIDDDSSQSENSAGQQMDAMMDEKENIATPEASRLAADSPLGDTSTVATPKASAGMLSSFISNVKNIFSPNSVNKTPIPLNHSVNVLNDSTSSHNNAIPRTPVSDVQVKSEKMTPKTPVMLYQTPSRGLPKTPDLQRVTHEEIIISPDPSRPIIKMEPVTPEDRQPVCPPRRVRHNSNDPIHFVLEPSPEPPRRSPVSHISNRSLHMTIVEDSPEPSELPSYRQSVKDRRLSRLSISNRFVQDSAENSPAVEMESSENSPNVVNMVTESDLEVVEDSGPEEMDDSSIVADQLHEPMRSSVSEEIGKVDTPTGVSETPKSAAGSRQKSAGRRRSVASNIPPANSKTGLVETPRSSVGTKQKSSNRRRSVSAKVVPKRISSDESFDNNDGDFEENIPGGSNKASKDGKKVSSKYQSSKSSKERRDEDNSESDVSLDDMDSPVQKKPTRRNKCAIQSSPEEPSPKSAQKGSLRKKRDSLPSAKDTDLRRQSLKGARNSASKNHNSKKENISRNNRVAAGNKNSRRRKFVQSEDSENELIEKNNSTHRTDVKKAKAFGGAGEEAIDSEGETTDNSEGEATDNSEGEATDNSKEETIDNSEDEASDNSEGQAVENSEEEESEEEDQNEEGSEDSFFDDEGASDEDFSGEEEDSEGEEDRGSSRGAGRRGDRRNDDRGSQGEGSMPKHVMEKFAKLEFKASKLFNRGQYEEALVPMLQALDIYPDPYMQAMVLKIHKMTKNKKKK